MSFQLKSIRGIDVKGKRVLVRVDFNVPLDDEGKVTDTTRLEESLPTLRYLAEQGAKIILASHLGRPNPAALNPLLKMDEVARAFSKLWGSPIRKLDDCIGQKATDAISVLQEREIVLLENTRFHPEEEQNDSEFSKKLATLADLYVNDAFGTAHRAHASTVGVTQHLPAYAGFLLEKEMEALAPLLENPQRPMVLIVGGAKIDTKIGVLKQFMDQTDTFIVGGGLANTFLAAKGYDVGASLCQKDKMSLAQEIMLECESHKEKFLVPLDVIVADEISETAATLDIPIEDVEGGMRILDIGSRTVERYVKALKGAKTIVWNGPLGLCEMKPFSKGTQKIAEAVASMTGEATTILGGGDTLDAIKRCGISGDRFTHVSTGGGAMLEFLEGEILPGIEVLKI
ncbi:MAG: Phosphoglycerate kinase [Candidatus Peregrinibacteria bacterium GW2011_GWA2_44_7]|nr:MAG: Phosphoglycerate kinase [Candidatus Peregrinibacteria bacterium GW2011_GWA2_44_7]